MVALTVKDARLELKTTQETKDLLGKAAVLNGLDLSAFMLACAVDKARAILRDHAALTLSAQAQQDLVRVLSMPAQPTAAMQELRKLPRLAVRG